MINRLFLKIRHHCRTHVCQTGLRITHGSRSIAFHRSEVTLAIDESLPHRPRLGHVYERWIDRTITVWVILTHRLTHNTGTLQVGLRCRQRKVVVHRIKQTALGRLETIPGIRQGPGDDD